MSASQTPKVAFFFDVDGTLLRSHELQAETLHLSFSEKMSELQIRSAVPSQEQLLSLLVGGTETASLLKVYALVPELASHMAKLIENAWLHYYKLLSQRSKEVAIESSITLLRTLFELGHAVALVTNSKRSDVERYCKLLKIDFMLHDPKSIVSREDSDLPKPSPDLYLEAAKKWRIYPSSCVVFEDSIAGVTSASKAGMYTVGLKSVYASDIALRSAGAHEVVSNLLSAKAVISHTYTEPLPTKVIEGLTWNCLTIQDQSPKVIESVISDTFKVYSDSLAGRTISDWRKKILDARDIRTRVILIYVNTSQLIGYNIVKIRRSIFRGQPSQIFLASAATLRSGHIGLTAGQLIVRFTQEEFRRGLLAAPMIKTHGIDNFISFSGYRVVLNVLKQVMPSMMFPVVPEELNRYMISLAPELGYIRSKAADDQVYLTSSHVKTPQPVELDKIGPDETFYYSRVDPTQHQGLFCIADVTYDNLIPMQSLDRNKTKL